MKSNRQRHNEEGRNQWNRKATFWDSLHGAEGNAFHRHLVSPAVGRLLDLKSGERVLDIACGSGVLARRLASLGRRVMAIDFSIHHFLKIDRYLDVPPTKAVGAPREPSPHYLYHRPLHELLGEAFAVGMVLDGLEEPSFGPEQADSARPLSWDNLWQNPPVMVGRMRVIR